MKQPCPEECDPDALVTVRYTGMYTVGRTYVAPSGTQFRFAAGFGQNAKVMKRSDADFFVRLPDFQVEG